MEARGRARGQRGVDLSAVVQQEPHALQAAGWAGLTQRGAAVHVPGVHLTQDGYSNLAAPLMTELKLHVDSICLVLFFLQLLASDVHNGWMVWVHWLGHFCNELHENQCYKIMTMTALWSLWMHENQSRCAGNKWCFIKPFPLSNSKWLRESQECKILYEHTKRSRKVWAPMICFVFCGLTKCFSTGGVSGRTFLCLSWRPKAAI